MRGYLVVAVLFAAVLSFTSAAIAQERDWHEVSVQGTGVFTRNSQGNGIIQQTTNSGGLLVNYRFHFNEWLATEANYGYNRNTPTCTSRSAGRSECRPTRTRPPAHWF